MATEFTPHYNLDKYTAQDKPNLRDQYNAAMDKIDLALLSANTNATEAKSATQGFQDQLDEKATKTELNTKASKTELQEAVEPLATKTALENEATARETAVQNESTARQTADTNLGARITKLETKKKLIIIGDSWSTPNTTHQVPVYWYQIVADYYGLDPITYAVGGVGFVVGGNNKFYNQLQKVYDDYTANEIGMIIVMGGTNDIASYNYSGEVLLADWRAAVRNFMDDISEKYPKVPKIIAGCNRNAHSFRQGNSRYDKCALWSWYLSYEISAYTRAAFVNMNLVGPFDRSFYLSDTDSHPSATGMKAIANMILGMPTAMGGLNWDFNPCVITDETIYNLDVQLNLLPNGGVHITLLGTGIAINNTSLLYFRDSPIPPGMTPIYNQTDKSVLYMSRDSSIETNFFNNVFKITGISASDYGNKSLFIEFDVTR